LSLLLLAHVAHAKCGDLTQFQQFLMDAHDLYVAGAMFADDVSKLATAPLNKLAKPQGPSMTVRVTPRGFVVGSGEPTHDLRPAVQANPNIQWEREHADAAMHGVTLEVEAAAPAKLLGDALAALADEKITQVWLVFRPKDRLDAPARSPLDAELTPKGRGPEDVQKLVQVIQRETAACPQIRGLLGRMGGQLSDGRLKIMVYDTDAALKECDCAMKPATVATIWWHLAFKNFGVAIPVDPTRKLPLGNGTWGEAAPKIIRLLAP
jgi:hypothetical protein